MLSITTNSELAINEPNEMYQSKSQNTQKTSDEAKKAALSKGKSFCKVCFDAKKSESIYTSHYVKSSPGPDGKLVCPTLLNQSCLKCGQTGHTSSYCIESNQSSQSNQSNQSKSKYKKSKPEFDDEPIEQNEQNEHNADATITEATMTEPKYNPRGNAFGALRDYEPKEPKEEFKQATKQATKPVQMTMAQRLKTLSTSPSSTQPLCIPDLPAKSQFWWQDLEED